MRSFRPSATVALVLAMALFAAAPVASQAPASPGSGGPVQGEPPTVGPVPTGSGEPMPDFVPVTAREGDGIAGYIATRDMPRDGSYPWWYQEPPIPVYASDLRTLVGFMFDGKGFMPLGVDPRTVPDFPATASASAPPAGVGPSLTLYVRSSDPAMTWLSVLPTPDPPQSLGFAAESGVACLAFPTGSHLALMDRTPADADARELRVIVPPRDPGVTTPVWVDVAADGTVTSGEGVPAWWPADQEPCRL